AAAAVFLGDADLGEARLGERGPQRGVGAVGGSGGGMGAGTADALGHRGRRGRGLGGPVARRALGVRTAHRNPIPRATIPRKISLVPPRRVNAGVCSTPAASNRAKGSPPARRGSTSVHARMASTTSPSKVEPRSLTIAASTSGLRP